MREMRLYPRPGAIAIPAFYPQKLGSNEGLLNWLRRRRYTHKVLKSHRDGEILDLLGKPELTRFVGPS